MKSDNKLEWDERTLLKLSRRYSKDETVAWLSKRIKESEIECGTLKSELAEFQDIIKERKMEIGELKMRLVQLERIKGIGISQEMKQNEYVKTLKDTIKRKTEIIKCLRDDNHRLISKVAQQANKLLNQGD